ncbi:MAG: putative RNA-binding protein (virulence factor B family) [Urechidicola sp.]|jgi:predicted RNA-binding protein (virulence factor B family)|tara:strand:+ start:10118 stop:10963 length:846 start_codon:yes stop_codon:yes gene_type:complete
MINLGEINKLTILRSTDNGFYLIDEEENEVLLPNNYIEKGWGIGDEVEVFVFKDSEDRITATNQTPKIKLNGFALLQVNDINSVGAFLNWGLPKDLFVPFKEQKHKMREGKHYVVTMFLDYESERLVASSKIDTFLEYEEVELTNGQEVDLIIYERTPLGYNCVINGLYKGLIYENEVFRDLNIGEKTTGYIKTLREDNKIDVSLQKVGYVAQDENQEKILNILKGDAGYIGLTDKSKPEDIYEELRMSKKAFKKAIGGLYKQKVIWLKNDGIYLANEGQE